MQPTQTVPQTPSVHVHFPNLVPQPQISIIPAQSSSGPASEHALTTVQVPTNSSSPRLQPVIDLTDETDHPGTTIYPTIGELLNELHETMPSLGFIRYEEQLLSTRFGYVHQIVDTPATRESFDQLEIPVGVRQEIFERAARMTRRAEKSKRIMKTEENPLT